MPYLYITLVSALVHGPVQGPWSRFTPARTQKKFTLCAKCSHTSIELGAMFDRLSHEVHTKCHDEGRELLCNFDSTSIK